MNEEIIIPGQEPVRPMDEAVEIAENCLVAADTYKMVLKGNMSRLFQPGQFVNVQVEGYTLRRPISISRFDPEEGTFVLYYKVLGEGTAKMAQMKAGQAINVFGPLGNGFPVEKNPSRKGGETVILVGGGAGIGPLIQTAKALKDAGYVVSVALGFPVAADIYGLDEFRALGLEPEVSTDDGSFGFRGNVLEMIEKRGIQGDMVYACGPKRMLKGVEERFQKGYISLDVRMACGMGACMACVCKDKEDSEKYHRVCKEGPVFPVGRVMIE